MPRTEIESSIWSSALAYIWHRMLFFPLGFSFNTLYHLLKSDRPINIVFVRPSSDYVTIFARLGNLDVRV